MISLFFCLFSVWFFFGFSSSLVTLVWFTFFLFAGSPKKRCSLSVLFLCVLSTRKRRSQTNQNRRAQLTFISPKQGTQQHQQWQWQRQRSSSSSSSASFGFSFGFGFGACVAVVVVVAVAGSGGAFALVRLALLKNKKKTTTTTREN